LSFSPFFVDFLCNFEIDWNALEKCRHVVLVAAREEGGGTRRRRERKKALLTAARRRRWRRLGA